MSTDPPTLSDQPIEQRSQDIRKGLERLGRWDWTLWGLAMLVIVGLTVAIGSFSLSILSDPLDAFYKFNISQSVRSLMGMVLLFTVYTLYQQIQIRRTRQQLLAQVDISAQEHLRAEAYLKLAMLDPLTGLHNRRFAEERLNLEISRAQRRKSSLTVLMMDLDDLKLINDRYGHGTGDLALKTFGQRLARAIRGSDLAVRIGGDEFVVLLPECNPAQVQNVLDRLTALEMPIEAERVSFYFSAGWTDYQVGETPERLLERADQALYSEKQKKKKQFHPVA